MDWKNSKLLKWAIFFVLFLFGLFCYMKDYGYAEEGGYISSISLDEEMNFFEEGIPVDQEYLFQYPTKCSISMRAEKWVNPYEHKWDNPVLKNNPPNYAQRKEWQDAYDNHHFHAIRTYQDAYNRVWWLPNLTWRQIGRDAWVAACAMASTKTPTSALIVAFSTMLSSYGLHCLDEWDYIKEKLYWSQYHFDQCVYYASLLNKA